MQLGIGALIYRLRNYFAGGLRATWYREQVRPRILQTPSLLLPARSAYEIHVLTSAADWLNLLWALKSYFHFSGVPTALCIHEDGTLSDEAAAMLLEHFPGARLIVREQADAEVLPTLSRFPNCRRFRETNNLSLKVFDTLHYANCEKILLLDSDILFYEHPADLQDALAADSNINWFNRDIEDAYTAERSTLEAAFELPVAERFNSGLCCLDKKSLRLDWLEEFLSHDSLEGHFWRIEQTLFCLCSSRYGAKPLPESYDVVLEPGLSGRVCKHYVGVIRRDMYREGMKHLTRAGFLTNCHADVTLPTDTEVVSA